MADLRTPSGSPDDVASTAAAVVPSISVIVPHYQDLDNLDRCLTLLERQTLPRSSYEIVISDNASPVGLDAVRAVVGNRGRVVLSTVKGAGHTRNVGVEASRGRILAFVDSDCRPEPDYLEEGIRMLDRFDIVGGRVRVDIETAGRPSAAEALEMVFAFRNDDYIRRKRFSVTATLFVTRAVFDAVGPFRNDVSEDMEWCNRATDMGRSLGYAEKAVIGHPARRDWPELARKWRRLTHESYGLAVARRHGRLRWVLFNLFVLAASVPQAGQVLITDRLERPRDRLAAIAMLFRLRLHRFGWAMDRLYRDRGRS